MSDDTGDMEEILQIFFQECDEQLPVLESGLSELSSGASSKETVNAIFRAVHSIKGGAGSFGLERVVRFAHVFESALDCLRSDKVEPTPEIIKTFLGAMDILSDLVAEARGSGHEVEDQRIATSQSKLEGIIEQGGGTKPSTPGESVVPEDFTPVAFDFSDFDEPAGAPPQPIFKVVRFYPHDALYDRGDDARGLLLSLRGLVEDEDSVRISCKVNPEISEDFPALPNLDAHKSYLEWRVRLPGHIKEEAIRSVFDWVGDACDFSISSTDGEGPDGGGTDSSTPFSTQEGQNDTPEAFPVEKDASGNVDATSPSSKELPQKGSTKPSPAQPKKQEKQVSIRVDLHRIDTLMDLIGEMVIAQAALEAVLEKGGNIQDQETLKSLASMKTLTRDVQDAVMAVRAQPVRGVFQRMNRVVREASSLANKEIILTLEGEDTEVDRTLVENLTEPLTHMLRNAVDHGIEKPEDRIAAGKTPQGNILLSAGHRSGRIVITIQDDGGGINRERVLAIAIKKGIVSPDANLSDDEINDLIFAPGFSTASTVSDLSGRGVGMDVVKHAIQSLGGRITIKSIQGKGTTFSLSLPLTLAVLDGMVIECRGSTMIVPVSSVVEAMEIKKKEDVYILPDGGSVASIRDTFMPLIFLGAELSLPLPLDRQEETIGNSVILVVENESGARAALVVDEIRDQTQVVIKSIENNYRHIPGVSAATILGDGSVSLILDVSALMAPATRRIDTRAASDRQNIAA
ncbi:chemotaxis protein CheA [Acetobacter pomorum]|uniref:Chemotaxis protein CheA n=1 Tax=Acetobacter pomorum TaxID=65959 RepID=A0A2G4RDS4_9PROT|nr:chemotaxis protein CheA [Acetobacter pomorum]PHY94739.1 chemotaxis protein CheA [Acetobacter pomorum]GBR53407.1 chemotaxis protein CheA [Acetobacter pomorum DSM 11825]